MVNVEKIQFLTKKELFELLKIYAKNWLAHDGCWFLAVENNLGIDTAIEFDTDSWRSFTVIEAKRLIKFLGLKEKSGLEGLAKALRFRLYATINEDKILRTNSETLLYYVKTCRVQEARHKKKLDDFPCKSVGIVEYSGFARTIDSRIRTECLSCPPDVSDKQYSCIWRFTISEDNNG